MNNCIRCGTAPATELEGYCTTCGTETRADIARGLERLEDYLASWAAFGDWTQQHDAAKSGSLRRRRRPGRVASYLPTGYSILSGAFAGGSLASLHGSGPRLAVAARPVDGCWVAELVTYASIELLDLSALRRLEVEIAGDATIADVELELQLYNWRANDWQLLKVVTDDGGRLELDGEPWEFVSPTGDLCLGVRAAHSQAFHARLGLVRFRVAT